MSEAKFTKGEWNIRRDQDTYEVYVKTYSNGMRFLDYVADVYEKEDAHLIAAATAMYKDIQEEIEWLERLAKKYVIGSYELQVIQLRIQRKKELLAKARGE